MAQIAIPRIYYEALEAALQGQVKRLARDISSTLKQTEQPFIKHLASQKIGIYLFEEEGSELVDIQSMRCPSYVVCQSSPSILVRCNEPILLLATAAAKACPYHCAHPQSAPATNLKTYRLIDSADHWVDDENVLYTMDLEPCGKYNPEKKICKRLVKIDEIVSQTDNNAAKSTIVPHGSGTAETSIKEIYKKKQ